MLRRAAVLAAAVVMLGVSLGMAREPGSYAFTQVIDFPDIDSNHAISETSGAVSTIEDTLFFSFAPFSYDGPWTDLIVKFVTERADTATQTGLCADSVKWYLQTKIEGDSSKWWHTVAATDQMPLKSWDSTGSSADTLTGEASFYNRKVTAALAGVGWANTPLSDVQLEYSNTDSVGVYGGLFRIQAEYHAEEDSLESDCVLHSSIGVFHPMEVLIAHIRFQLR